MLSELAAPSKGLSFLLRLTTPPLPPHHHCDERKAVLTATTRTTTATSSTTTASFPPDSTRTCNSNNGSCSCSSTKKDQQDDRCSSNAKALRLQWLLFESLSIFVNNKAAAFWCRVCRYHLLVAPDACDLEPRISLKPRRRVMAARPCTLRWVARGRGS